MARSNDRFRARSRHSPPHFSCPATSPTSACPFCRGTNGSNPLSSSGESTSFRSSASARRPFNVELATAHSVKSAAAGQRLPATNGRVDSSEQSSMPGNLSAFRSSIRPSSRHGAGVNHPRRGWVAPHRFIPRASWLHGYGRLGTSSQPRPAPAAERRSVGASADLPAILFRAARSASAGTLGALHA